MWQMERPHLAVHILQPLKPQVSDDSRAAVIHGEDGYSELLRCGRHNLWGKNQRGNCIIQTCETCQAQDLQNWNP